MSRSYSKKQSLLPWEWDAYLDRLARPERDVGTRAGGESAGDAEFGVGVGTQIVVLTLGIIAWAVILPAGALLIVKAID